MYHWILIGFGIKQYKLTESYKEYFPEGGYNNEQTTRTRNCHVIHSS